MANQVAARAGVTPAGDGAGACPGDRRGERERGGRDREGRTAKQKTQQFPHPDGPPGPKNKKFLTPQQLLGLEQPI